MASFNSCRVSELFLKITIVAEVLICQVLPPDLTSHELLCISVRGLVVVMMRHDMSAMAQEGYFLSEVARARSCASLLRINL